MRELATRFAFRRASWFIPAFFLNILFLGTAHVLSHLPFPLWAMYILTMGRLSVVFHTSIQTVYDYASFLLASLTVLLIVLAYRNQGPKKTLLDVLQIGSLCIMPLGVEIFTVDHSEWYLHVTQFQANDNIVPWFTNADLLLSCITLLVAATLVKWRMLRSKSARVTLSSLFE